MSAGSTARTPAATSLRPVSRTLRRLTCAMSNSKPLSHFRSPVKPGSPEGGTNDANSASCVIAASSYGAGAGALSMAVGARECGTDCESVAKHEEAAEADGPEAPKSSPGMGKRDEADSIEGHVRGTRMVEERREETQRERRLNGVK